MRRTYQITSTGELHLTMSTMVYIIIIIIINTIILMKYIISKLIQMVPPTCLKAGQRRKNNYITNGKNTDLDSRVI